MLSPPDPAQTGPAQIDRAQIDPAHTNPAQTNPAQVDLLVLGDCNPDVLVLGGDVTPAFGQQEKLVDTISLVVGGSAAITAVAAARLGLGVALVAAVGADPAGTFMLDRLAREGVDVSAVAIRGQAPTGMTVALSRGGDRAILTALGAMTSLTAADVPPGLLARARHVHVSSYFLLEDSLGPGLAGLLAAARAAGASTSLDTNWDPSGRWGDERLTAAIAQADLLLPNEAEALRLSGQADLDKAVTTLTAAGPRLVVKLGERGALCADGLARHQVSVAPVTPADTTGAGDCFNAGLIAGLLEGLPLPEAAALGCATGALSTGAPGGTASAPGPRAAARLARHAKITTVMPNGPGRLPTAH
jgi:sugar/nucleoside kinase (ribokinase family)